VSEKQIFAAIEASDHEIRLVIGEFFNTRFNIIKVERIPCSGLTFSEVKDPDAVSTSIRKAVEEAKKMISADIRMVILAVPSYRMKRYSVKTTVEIRGIDGVVTAQDVKTALGRAMKTKIDPSLVIVQSVPVKYTVNGVSSKRMPLDERCTEMTVDVDLLCADKKLTFDLVECVENTGLKVMDVFLDIYAVGKEAALFEQANDHQIIVLKVEREATTLGLIRKGRLTTAAILPAGIGTIAGAITEKYSDISSEMAVELLLYSARLNQTVCSSNPVHIWSENGETRTISEQELVDCVRDYVNLWLDSIEKTCIPILQAGPTAVMITGEGGETEGLDDLVSERLHVETQTYIPETLGGRNAGLTACLGLFYAYQDRLPITGYEDESLDMDAFINAVSYRESSDENKEDTLTDKLKGLFLEGKKN